MPLLPAASHVVLAVQRDGNDLIHTAPIPLVDALCGCTLSVQHLDGSLVEVPLRDIVQPSSIKIIK
jgi:DnaJ-class molecular chaperone